MAVLKTSPYVAMINQRFQRTYVDCKDLLQFLGFSNGHVCCAECGTVADDPYRPNNCIYIHPAAEDGQNSDWAMNIEGVVCCKHIHLIRRVMTREKWSELARKVGATPFFADRNTKYGFDESGQAILSSRDPGPGRTGGAPNAPRNGRRLVGVPRVEKEPVSAIPMTKCEFHGVRHPMYGKCPTCFPGVTNV